MFILPIDTDAHLGLLQVCHAGPLYELQERNRDRLVSWMPHMKSATSVEAVSDLIEEGLQRFGAGRGVSTGIWWRGQLAGWAGMRIHEDGYGSLGYWLGGDYEGKGLATQSCITLSSYAFETFRLRRIEIRIEVSNRKSIAVAERAGFVYEGRLRKAIEVNGALQDLLVYSRLSTD